MVKKLMVMLLLAGFGVQSPLYSIDNVLDAGIFAVQDAVDNAKASFKSAKKNFKRVRHTAVKEVRIGMECAHVIVRANYAAARAILWYKKNRKKIIAVALAASGAGAYLMYRLLAIKNLPASV